jgi:hypothetical protein
MGRHADRGIMLTFALIGAVTMLLFRPDGLTRGHEFTWPFLRHGGDSRPLRRFASLRKVMPGVK